MTSPPPPQQPPARDAGGAPTAAPTVHGDDAGAAADAPRWQRAYLTACLAIIGGAFAYWFPSWAQAPILSYLPVERRWTTSPPAGVIAMAYPGLVLWGAAGALVGAGLGALIGTALDRGTPRPLSPPALRLCGAWAVTAIVLTGWYYTWNLWPF